MNNTKRYFEYTFADGYFCYSGRMSRDELFLEEKKHGKLITKQPLKSNGQTYRTHTGKEYRF